MEKKSIKLIEYNDLCISCGSCIHICPFNNIDMKYSDDREKYDAVVRDIDICASKCNGLKNCLSVCPSYNTEYYKFNSHANNLLGNIEKVYCGWSKTDSLRLNSSSGGFIKTLCNKLLDEQKIDGVISITHDHGLNYTPKLITDLNSMPTSIYHNINFENAFNIIKEKDGKFVLIGLPCQITGIEKLLSKKKYFNLRDRVFLKIALICGHTFDRSNIKLFSKIYNINLESVRYRDNAGRKKRGSTFISKSSSKIFDIYNLSSIFDKISISLLYHRLLVQKNCLYCVDHIGYCADIVVGDAWQKKYEIQHDKGVNIIIVRSKFAHKIVGLIRDAFHFENVDIDDIIESQGAYATPFLGLNFARLNIFKDKFVPMHKVSYDDIKFYYKNISLKDRIVIVLLKKIIRQQKKITSILIYMILESKYILKLCIKKILGRKL